MDPITFVAVGLVGLALWALSSDDEDQGGDTPGLQPGVLPTPILVPVKPGPVEPDPEAPIRTPPIIIPAPEPEPEPEPEPVPNDGLTETEQKRQAYQFKLEDLGYQTDTNGKRTSLYVSAVDSFQFDVLKGQNYYAGGDGGSKPLQLLQQYGVMEVDGSIGPQTRAWLNWAHANQTPFSQVTFAATGDYPGS